MTNQYRAKDSIKNSRAARAELAARPATAPAYFRGRPATVWLAAFRTARRTSDPTADHADPAGITSVMRHTADL
jgi:hypothetical protein